MAQNFDLTQTGPELQARIDQVYPNRDNIAAENQRAEGVEQQLDTDKASREELTAETTRATEAEAYLQSQITGNAEAQQTVNEQVNTELADRYTKAETYNREELDAMITTPSTEYITVDTYAELLALTDHPNGAVYRVANYDGTQAVTDKYAEYTWTGEEYKLMAVHSIGNDTYYSN